MQADDVTSSPKRRKLPACVRCRQRKVKCDSKLPNCTNCEKAGVDCDHAASQDRIRVVQLLERVEYLESLLRQRDPDTQLSDEVETTEQHHDAGDTLLSRRSVREPLPVERRELTAFQHQANTTWLQHAPHGFLKDRKNDRGASSVTPGTSVDIGPEQPLAHDVGLLSLGNAGSDPKYLGPSSGVTFARLVFASALQSQGFPSHLSTDAISSDTPEPQRVTLPSLAQMHRFADAYLETSVLHPFLPGEIIEEVIERTYATNTPQHHDGSLDIAMLFLVAALGARSLERGLHVDLGSENFLASAMAKIALLQLHDSVQGVQILLLLVVVSLWFPRGLNAYFLTATIIASCLDLGLQRKQIGTKRKAQGPSRSKAAEENIRSGVFWSAYSLERTLATTLGRPLCLRDEAIDIEFPGETGTGYTSYAATVFPPPLKTLTTGSAQFECSTKAEFLPASFSFRFDRIIAEIKLMIFRVVQLPERFPWPTDLVGWQKEAHEACNILLASARQAIGSKMSNHSHNRRALQNIETKYHQCVLLLFRPSPAFKKPGVEAFAICLASSLELLSIHAEQLRFGQLADTWLTAHMVFMAGITMIYSAWTLPGNGQRLAVQSAPNTFIPDTSAQDLEVGIKNCSEVLEYLGQTWSVARDARAKFDSLAAITLERMRNGSMPFTAGTQEVLMTNANVDLIAGPGHTVDAALDQDWQEDITGIDFGAVLDPPDFLWDQLGDFSSLYDFSWMTEQTQEKL